MTGTERREDGGQGLSTLRVTREPDSPTYSPASRVWLLRFKVVRFLSDATRRPRAASSPLSPQASHLRPPACLQSRLLVHVASSLFLTFDGSSAAVPLGPVLRAAWQNCRHGECCFASHPVWRRAHCKSAREAERDEEEKEGWRRSSDEEIYTGNLHLINSDE